MRTERSLCTEREGKLDVVNGGSGGGDCDVDIDRGGSRGSRGRGGNGNRNRCHWLHGDHLNSGSGSEGRSDGEGRDATNTNHVVESKDESDKGDGHSGKDTDEAAKEANDLEQGHENEEAEQAAEVLGNELRTKIEKKRLIKTLQTRRGK